MTGRAAAVALAVSLVVVGCGAGGRVSRIRFHNQPPVSKVNDRVSVPKPAKRGFPKKLYYFDMFFHRRLTRLLEVPEPRRAAGVNAIDEVPDSTFFHNRIGTGTLTADDVRRGPATDDGPDRSAPFSIKGTKVGGSSVGFVMKDARGVKYIVKFDQKGIPEMETGADVVVSRLLWAAGYHVPEDQIVYFTRKDVVLAPDASVSDTFGNERPMTERDLDGELAKCNVNERGEYRALVSKFLPGVPLGGMPTSGTREDDPNDLIPHEERRDQRGQFAIFAWLDHTDVKEDNTLDMWVTDPVDPDRHYVMHYLVDFGKAMGAMGWIDAREEDGFAYDPDFEYMLYSLVSFGLWKRPWEEAEGPVLRGVGRFESEQFDPETWRAGKPWDPFHRRDRFDGYWGAKIVARFTPAMIAAAVDAGQYSDPRAAAYLTKTLIERQRKTLLYWFNEVAPVDEAAVRDGRLCFADLGVRYAVARPDRTTYRAHAYDYRGVSIGALAVEADGSGGVCTAAVTPGALESGYTIVRIDVRRVSRALSPTEIHLAAGADGALRVVGLRRH